MQKGARRRASALGRSAGSLKNREFLVLLQGTQRVALHCAAVIHEIKGYRTDYCTDIFGYGKGLVEATQFVDSANRFFIAPWSASGEHLEYHAAKRPDVNFGATALIVV